MNKEEIEKHIEVRKSQLKETTDLWILYARNWKMLHIKEEDYTRFRTKISSQIAFLEKSIADHKRSL